MKFSSLRRGLLPLFLLGVAASSCRSFSGPGAAQTTRVEAVLPMAPPQSDGLWTSSDEVRALKIVPSGVWAATAGGVLHFDGAAWKKWTRKEGLPSNEALQFEAGETVSVRFPVATANFGGGKWQVAPAPVFAPRAPQTRWKNRALTVSLDGLKWGSDLIAMPGDSSGTHVTGVLAQPGGTLLVAIYGDGLWRFDGARWGRVAGFPLAAREVTALAQGRGQLWVGTRRDGIFGLQSGKWSAFSQPDEPRSHNIQNLAQFEGVLWASTLDDGLVCRTAAGWRAFSTPILSSSAPRQMVEWNKKLYVRHGGGVVDSFDGKWWTKNALGDIPRRGVYALGGDDTRLYAAGWGGWSEWDGATWTAHFGIAELKNVPVLGILPDGDEVYLATQSRGLGRWNRATQQVRWFDERDGLSDDWITALAKIEGKIYAGTFVGGLARLDGEKWHVFPETRGLNVTAIAASGATVYASTRHGMWEIKDGSAQKSKQAWLEGEQQALLPTPGGLWLGARTGLSFLSAGS